MHILIVGAGIVGSNLARQLALENQNISLVDENAARLDEVAARVDCLTVCGSGASPSVLQRAGIERAQMVIAVTDNDSVNLVICALAERFGVKRKIARVRNTEYEAFTSPEVDGRNPIGTMVDQIINPDQIIVRALEHFINSPGATEVADFGEGAVQLRKFPVREGAPLVGKTMMELQQFTSIEPFLVIAISRGDETIIPRGSDRIQAGDEVVLIMPDGVQPFVLPLVGNTLVDVNKVIIDGTTPVAIELAHALEQRIDQVWLIEEDPARAEVAADLVERAQVIVGRSTDPELHEELGTEHADFFVALGENDEHSLLGTLLARKLGAKRVIMLVREVDYLDILRSIGVDIAVNARLLTTSEILRFVRRGRIVSVARFHGDEAEAIELCVDPDARITGKPLKDVSIPRGAIVGAVQRGEDIFLPNGATVIEPGDFVTVFSLASSISKVEKMFEKKGLFG